MIIMTTRSSTSVKPADRFIARKGLSAGHKAFLLPAPCSLLLALSSFCFELLIVVIGIALKGQVIDAEYRQQHRDDNQADDQSHPQDQRRLQQ